MKKILIYLSLAILNFVINFIIYNWSFNIQATPYLHESQRVDSGLLMLKTTMPAYALAALVFTVIFYFIAKSKKHNKRL